VAAAPTGTTATAEEVVSCFVTPGDEQVVPAAFP
jgi:hypothetical protein